MKFLLEFRNLSQKTKFSLRFISKIIFFPTRNVFLWEGLSVMINFS